MMMRGICHDLDLGAHTIVTPSGAVPGGDDGARIWRSFVTYGEDSGPDCFCFQVVQNAKV
jgi:hypothetical protein